MSVCQACKSLILKGKTGFNLPLKICNSLIYKGFFLHLGVSRGGSEGVAVWVRKACARGSRRALLCRSQGGADSVTDVLFADSVLPDSRSGSMACETRGSNDPFARTPQSFHVKPQDLVTDCMPRTTCGITAPEAAPVASAIKPLTEVSSWLRNAKCRRKLALRRASKLAVPVSAQPGLHSGRPLPPVSVV